MEKGKIQVNQKEMTQEEHGSITYKTDFEAHITLKDLHTDDAVKYLKRLLPDDVKQISEIKHYRKKNEVFYRTIFKIGYVIIDCQSGIASGYDGTGPTGFYEVLTQIVDKDIASIVYDRTYNNAVITIK